MAGLRGFVGGCAVAAAIGCGPVIDDPGGGSGGEDSSEGGQGGSVSGTATVATSATTATASASASASDSVSASASATVTDTVSVTDETASATATFTATDPTDSASATMTTASSSDSDTDSGGDLMNGAMCIENAECESGHCFVVGPLGGICGECEVDSDCPDGGCTIPQPLAQPPVGSICNDGSYADGCMGDDVCADDLVCGVTIDVPGILTVATCGECVVDAECETGFVCAPDISLVALNGVKRCVAEGTLANGQSCDYQTSGDVSCLSGHCAVADLMGFVQFGVCSSCEVDMDCPDGQTCEPPQAEVNVGFIPGSCV